MIRYQIRNLNVNNLKEAKEDIQKSIENTQEDLLIRERHVLVNMKGKIQHVSCPEMIGIVGDILLPEGVRVSKWDDVFISYIGFISVLASNYLAKRICDTVDKEIYYENLRTTFYDPEDITEYSYAETDTDEIVCKDVIGCYLIENQMFGICFVEQLYLEVMLSVKTDIDGRILEIESMYSSILGA